MRTFLMNPRLTALAFAAALSTPAPCPACEFVVISELHRNPYGGESDIPGGRSHEFVELCNLGTDTLRLDSLCLGDRRDNDHVVAYTDPRGRHPHCVCGANSLPPGRVAVVLDPDYDSALTLDRGSARLFADSTWLFTVDDHHLGDASGLSATEGVILYMGIPGNASRILAVAADSASERTVLDDGLYLQTGSAEGVSVVVVSVLFGDPVYASCPSGTSPGVAEIVDRGWVFETRLDAASGDSADVAVAALGPAGTDIAACELDIVCAASATSPVLSAPLVDAGGVLRSTITVPFDTAVCSVVLSHGTFTVERPVDISPLWVPAAAVRITELFPRADGLSPEWLEVCNMSRMAVNLRGWRVGDSEDTAILAGEDLVLESGAFWTFTRDSAGLRMAHPTLRRFSQTVSWRTLDNYSATLCLWDNRGILHDSIQYDHHWYDDWDRGSLQRVSPSRDGTGPTAWAPTSHPTPSLPNSVVGWRSAGRFSLDIGPVPFTPNGDGVDDLLALRCSLPAGASVGLTVYAMDGEAVRRFDGELQELTLWDGRSDSGRPVTVGPIFVVAEVTCADGSAVRVRKRGVLWR